MIVQCKFGGNFCIMLAAERGYVSKSGVKFGMWVVKKRGGAEKNFSSGLRPYIVLIASLLWGYEIIPARWGGFFYKVGMRKNTLTALLFL